MSDVLCCPNCGFNYLHHFQVDVYERKEDASTGLHVRVNGVDTNEPLGKGEVKATAGQDHNMRGNPSERRGGLVVSFWCENCDVITELAIAQHKGWSYITLEARGKDMMPLADLLGDESTDCCDDPAFRGHSD